MSDHQYRGSRFNSRLRHNIEVYLSVSQDHSTCKYEYLGTIMGSCRIVEREQLESSTGRQLQWIEVIGEVSFSRAGPDQGCSAFNDDDDDEE